MPTEVQQPAELPGIPQSAPDPHQRLEEKRLRDAIVEEAKTWLGTPYHPCADVKGAGVDCGMLLVRVYCDLGLIERFDPRPYPSQWALHQRAELYLELVKRFGRELPEGEAPKRGDAALFKFGHCWAHGAIITDWPNLIHANPSMNPNAPCREDNWLQNTELHKRPPRFFSCFPQYFIRERAKHSAELKYANLLKEITA